MKYINFQTTFNITKDQSASYMSDLIIWLRKQKKNSAHLLYCREDGQLPEAQSPQLWQIFGKWYSLFVTNWITAFLNTIPISFDYKTSQKTSNHDFKSSGSPPVPALCLITALWQKARVNRIATHHAHYTGFIEAARKKANDGNEK